MSLKPPQQSDSLIFFILLTTRFASCPEQIPVKDGCPIIVASLSSWACQVWSSLSSRVLIFFRSEINQSIFIFSTTTLSSWCPNGCPYIAKKRHGRLQVTDTHLYSSDLLTKARWWEQNWPVHPCHVLFCSFSVHTFVNETQCNSECNNNGRKNVNYP